MRFLVDAQLPIALARMLQHGHESKHVADLKMMETPDRDIWLWAKQSKSIIISKDEDFVILYSADVSLPSSSLGVTTQQAPLAETHQAELDGRHSQARAWERDKKTAKNTL